jgi:hypothetical protein
MMFPLAGSATQPILLATMIEALVSLDGATWR